VIHRGARRAAFVALLAILLPIPSWASDRFIEYLYIDANEGGSSGGHVAVRVDDDVFHYEYRRPGILVLRREPFVDFRHDYTGLDNRSIEASRIPVDEATFTRVRERFRRRHFVQRRRLEVLDTLRTERWILEHMVQGRVELDGVGFFSDEGGAPESALVALRDRVLDIYGRTFLTERMDVLRRRLEALGAPEVPEPRPAASVDETPAPAYGFARRYRDTLTALAALEVLASARSLRPEATITAAAEELRVDAEDARRVQQLADALTASLIRLLDSRRPDWGFPLLLGMARLATLERARESGRWVFLDAFPPHAAVIERTRVPGRPEVIGAMLTDARSALDIARRRLTRSDGTFDERGFADFEAAGNRVAEIRRAIDEGRDLRLPYYVVVPSRSEWRPAVAAPSAAGLNARLVVAREREQAYELVLERLYGYQLVTRNCVTEILRELDAALLGEHLDVDGVRAFVPALSPLVVKQRYGVSDVVRIPSHRRARLARLYEEQNPVRVFLRESNTITSTLYWQTSRDSTFVFFTDDVVVTRPLFGAVNLITGVGTSAVGLVTAPFDRGKLLRSGLRGAFFSLPELVFQNIRKGSFEYVGQPIRD
jgi:hypothetical protein